MARKGCMNEEKSAGKTDPAEMPLPPVRAAAANHPSSEGEDEPSARNKERQKPGAQRECSAPGKLSGGFRHKRGAA